MERRMLGGRGGSKICGAVSGQGEGHIHGWEHSELGRARRRRRRAGGGCAVQTGSGAASGRQAMAVSRRAGRGGETCCAEGPLDANWLLGGAGLSSAFSYLLSHTRNGRPAALEANRMSPLEFRGGPLEKGLYRGHVWLPRSARVLMGFGAWVALQRDLRRADLVGILSELTALPCVLRRLHAQMLGDLAGRRLLREQPRINSNTVNRQALRALPPDTFGRVYAEWMDAYRLSPDTRGTVRGGQKDSTGAQRQAEREASRETNVGCVLAFPDVPSLTASQVRYINNAEWAYVVQRYRESHDFYHALVGLPATLEGEVALKCFELCNLGLPIALFSILAGAPRLSSAARRRLWTLYFPWALH
ncbi:unnamed protein product, partial [Pneumocystis jirovecii]